MKVLVLYRPMSEHARRVEEFLHDLQRQHDVQQDNLKIIDLDSREGIASADLYSIVDAPAIVVTSNDGGFITSWQGSELPLMRDVAMYTFDR